MKRMFFFALGFLLSVYVLPWVLTLRGRPRDPWKPATICDDEDVPPYNFVMTRTDSGHTVTVNWTWS